MAAETGSATYAHTGATYATPLHLVRAGTRWGQGAPSQTRDALSGAVRVGGAILPMVRLNLFPVDANCFIDKIEPASVGALPADCILELGNSTKNIQALDWKINVAEIECEVNGALQVGYELVNAAKPTYSTGGTPGTKVTTTFEWYRGYVTTGGSPYECRRIRFRAGNNIIGKHSLNQKASDKRYPDSLVEGAFTVEAEAEYYDDPGHETGGDEMTTSTIVLVAVNNAATPKTITITGTDMHVPEWYFEPGGASELNRYTVPYELDENELASWSAAIA